MPFDPERGPLDHSSTKEKTGLGKPKQFRILLHNDDYTPMDFVVDILMTIFAKDRLAAMQVMLNVHNLGQGVCGVYTYEVAETKLAKVHELASQQEYPLKATMEEE